MVAFDDMGKMGGKRMKIESEGRDRLRSDKLKTSCHLSKIRHTDNRDFQGQIMKIILNKKPRNVFVDNF